MKKGDYRGTTTTKDCLPQRNLLFDHRINKISEKQKHQAAADYQQSPYQSGKSYMIYIYKDRSPQIKSSQQPPNYRPVSSPLLQSNKQSPYYSPVSSPPTIVQFVAKNQFRGGRNSSEGGGATLVFSPQANVTGRP